MTRSAKKVEKPRRDRGTGAVYYSPYDSAKAGYPVYIARISLGSRGGKPIRHERRARSEDEARMKLRDLQRSYGAGTSPADMTLDEYLAEWLASHGPSVKPRTREFYASMVKDHISPLLGGIVVSKLTPSDVRRLIADRLAAKKPGKRDVDGPNPPKTLSPSTVIRVVATLRVALGVLAREGAIAMNPAAAVKLPRVDRESVRALTDIDVRRIRAAIAGDPLEPLYLLLLGSGLRLGEAISLDWRDVDLEVGAVAVRKGKTESSKRTVGITAYAVAALRLHKAARKVVDEDSPVFLGAKTGERLSAWTASHAFPRRLTAKKLRRMRVHDLRHAHATRMLAHGVPMRVIADQLGHADPAMTARVYAHVVPASLRTAVAQLDLDMVEPAKKP